MSSRFVQGVLHGGAFSNKSVVNIFVNLSPGLLGHRVFIILRSMSQIDVEPSDRRNLAQTNSTRHHLQTLFVQHESDIGAGLPGDTLLLEREETKVTDKAFGMANYYLSTSHVRYQRYYYKVVDLL